MFFLADQYKYVFCCFLFPVAKGREDLAKHTKAFLPGSRMVPPRDPVTQSKTVRDEEDGMEYMDKEVRSNCSTQIVLLFSTQNE